MRHLRFDLQFECVRNNIQGKQLIDLDYDGITIENAIGNSQGVKRLNQNLYMSDSHQGFEEDISICLTDLTPKDLTLDLTRKKHTEQYTITHFSSVLPVYIIA